MRRGLALAFLVLAAAGCGASHHAAPPVSDAQRKAVVRDWLANGSLRQQHSCGALVVALGSLAYWHAGYSTVFSDIRGASKSVCTTRPAFSRISVGMSNAAVAAAAGMPRRVGPHCWLYSARRVCFTGGRVSLVQYVTHG